MSAMPPKRMRWAVALLALGGCVYPVREQADRVVCELAARPMDLEPAPDAPPRMPPALAGLAPAAHQTAEPQPAPPRPGLERLQTPPGLPGSDAPPFEVPRATPETEAARRAAIDRLFPEIPPLGPDPKPLAGPEGRPLSLSDLQRLALANSPAVRQAAADVEAARGAAVQAGLPPNPTFGYAGDTLGTGGGAGYQGAFIEQVIKTGGKLQLARDAALFDLRQAELALRRAQTDLATQVRAAYFAVLVARENARVSRALERFTHEIFRAQVGQLKAAQVAAYEPAQFRILALQARSNLIQARNRETAAWKQLATAVGLPGLPPTELAGRIDLPVPVFKYDQVLARALSSHTDVLTAEAALQRARVQVRLAQVGAVPDVTVQALLQRDHTSDTFLASPSFSFSFPVPVFDRNQGNVVQAQGALVRAEEGAHRARVELTAKLAETFERYENNRVLLGFYRGQILADQVRVYQGVYERFQQQPDEINFSDVASTQQALAGVVRDYLANLGAFWTSVVDVANLLQTDDLFTAADGPPQCVPPVPDLERLLPLPCCHPCSPLQNPVLRGADGAWPPADRPASGPKMPAAPETPTSKRTGAVSDAVMRQLLEPPPEVPRPSRR